MCFCGKTFQVKRILTCAILFLCTGTFFAQKPVLKGSVERFLLHGKSLEGNLDGDSADRFVTVYLPPSYTLQTQKHYPVIYFLHGFTDNDAKYFGLAKHWMNLPPVLDSTFLNKEARDMIVVMANADTRFRGSWYSNSITTGNWEEFICRELVTAIDKKYRTLPKAASRGLFGHSMGGYGALRLGEKYPDIFSAIYLQSPSTIMPIQADPLKNRDYWIADNIHDMNDFDKAGFGPKIVLACAAAWSPNPARPPFYVDLPVQNGQLNPDVLTKWSANMPLSNLDQYITNLKKLKAIAFDAGNKDELIAASVKVLDTELSKYGIDHFFEIYEGTHTNRIAERIRKNLLPYFSRNLAFEK